MTNPYEPPTAPGYPGYAGPGAGQPARTTGLTVLAYFCVILGGFGLLSVPMSLVSKLIAKDPFSRALQEATWSGGLGVYMGFSLLIGTIFSALLVTTGIGIFKMRPWGRSAGMAYGVGSLVFMVVGQIVNFTVMQPIIESVAAQFPDNPAAKMGAMAGMIGAVGGAFIGSILPITVLVVMTRPDVKAKFVRD
jgi:hypothetical protein